MFYKKKTYKPLYKKFLLLKKNIQNREKIYKFKKKKWKNLLLYLNRFNPYKSKRIIKLFDHNLYFVSKFDSFFKNKYKYNLHTKQKISLFYGKLTKRYLKKIFSRSKNMKLIIYNNNNINYFFESRLDVVLYRSHFVLSIRSARQLIFHGQILINDKVIKLCSFILKKGDKIKIKYFFHKVLKYNVIKSKLWPLPSKNLHICYKTFNIIIIDTYKKENISIYFPFWLDINTLTRIF